LQNRFKIPPVNVDISTDYLDKNDGVREWLVSYCKANKIRTSTSKFHCIGDYRDMEERLVIHFRSNNQMRWFQLKGNQNYPYFEFL